ncbi:MAG: GntR family transcriptional regulator [Gaiellaceae bacterium]
MTSELASTAPLIEFHLDGRSGVPAYLQLVQQVRQAVRLGILRPGDQLPTVKEVVTSLTINPNTVLHAYRQLDLEGLVEGKRGVGTFISSDPVPPPPDELKNLRSSLERWAARARSAGLDDESIAALVADTLRPTAISRVA